jgi:arylsulfatase A-like enzyme
VEPDHAAVIHYLDEQVGQIMAGLKQLGVDDNTMVVFAADNGAHQEGRLKRCEPLHIRDANWCSLASFFYLLLLADACALIHRWP